MPERFFPLIKFSSLNPCCFHRSLVSLRFIFVRHFWSSVRALAYYISVYLTQEQNPDTDFFFSFLFYLFIFFSGFCHTLTCISHGYTCIPHPDPPSYRPLHPIPLGLPSAPGLNTCLMHPTWAGDLFHPR